MAKKELEMMQQKAKLIKPKKEFCQLIAKQIERGKGLLDIQVNYKRFLPRSNYVIPSSRQTVQYDKDQFEEFKNKKEKWVNFCLELLKQSFDISNNEYYKDFENQISIDSVFGSSDWVSDYKKEIQKKIQNLESLMERIDLIPSSVDNDSLGSKTNYASAASSVNTQNVFIVYGHDVQMKLEMEHFIHELKLNPITLDSQPNEGLTIIEKFGKYASEVRYAIILMSPDDESEVEGQVFKRARQNVIMEMGYFMAKLGRSYLCIVQKGDVEIPSDIAGILHVKYEGNWQMELLKEIKKAGIPV